MTAPVDDAPPYTGGFAPAQTPFVPDASATQLVPDASATQFVPDASATQFVPDAAGSLATRLPSAPVVPLDALPRLGRFQALARLGAGATGSVYRAYDDALGREVAIKVLHGGGELAVRERFRNEARAVCAVAHPHIVAIHDVVADAGAPYLVMELAAGGSLRDRLERGPLAVDGARAVGIQIARALAAAHAAGILHRDVKPANILATGGARALGVAHPFPDGVAPAETWKLADFGIARLPDSTLTLDGQFLGSPAYAAPEALRAGLFSPASDVYALGATLYEALTGEPPHGADDVRVIIRKLDEDVRQLPACVPPALAAAILAALARDPARRPSAAQLADALVASVHDAAAAPPARAWSRVVAIGAALAAVAVWIVFLTRARPAPEPAAPAPVTTAKPVETPAPAPPARGATAGSGAPVTEPPAPAAPDEAPEAAEPSPSADAIERSIPGFAEAHDGFASPPAAPAFVDEHGRPIDDTSARALLERMERDARDAYERSWRKHGGRRWRWAD